MRWCMDVGPTLLVWEFVYVCGDGGTMQIHKFYFSFIKTDIDVDKMRKGCRTKRRTQLDGWDDIFRPPATPAPPFVSHSLWVACVWRVWQAHMCTVPRRTILWPFWTSQQEWRTAIREQAIVQGAHCTPKIWFVAKVQKPKWENVMLFIFYLVGCCLFMLFCVYIFGSTLFNMTAKWISVSAFSILYANGTHRCLARESREMCVCDPATRSCCNCPMSVRLSCIVQCVRMYWVLLNAETANAPRLTTSPTHILIFGLLSADRQKF